MATPKKNNSKSKEEPKLPEAEQPEDTRPFDPNDDVLDIQINSFGEILSNYSIDQLNEFLNKAVDDKKLRNRKRKPPQK
ncbi:hypothetical protein [Eisenibacter elegans]|jgi:hypothetical protein|uniref:hypothetical protein n=1 Tax=Eisenibacter elegans TaxID=997 RepID=UPI00041E97AC|nr:hypothetical protein [Eisenibacter elegans]